ncbi:hypothetical protein [Alicyclobacillus dauci]|uniref:Uncharacterized protein n=1 Tax=Alicyclobacillus dauci TaxID=1475485 RepID=A0ABY6Z7H6_9BACL|nr:hypothetical protein [Alicyclobacillus dauci]WAH38777.1 hypothetical protein NZD86_10005 [Alicyclobacillus dauci]
MKKPSKSGLISVSVGNVQSLTVPMELGAIIGLLLYLSIRE